MHLSEDDMQHRPDRVRAAAHMRLDDDEAAGGDRRVLARMLRPQLQQHERLESGACRECGDPWPCGPWRLALAPE